MTQPLAFRAPEVHFGLHGGLECLKQLLRGPGAICGAVPQRVTLRAVIVADDLLDDHTARLLPEFERRLRELNLSVHTYRHARPDLKTVCEVADRLATFDAHVCLALGGQLAMDTAKLARIACRFRKAGDSAEHIRTLPFWLGLGDLCELPMSGNTTPHDMTKIESVRLLTPTLSPSSAASRDERAGCNDYVPLICVAAEVGCGSGCDRADLLIPAEQDVHFEKFLSPTASAKVGNVQPARRAQVISVGTEPQPHRWTVRLRDARPSALVIDAGMLSMTARASTRVLYGTFKALGNAFDALLSPRVPPPVRAMGVRSVECIFSFLEDGVKRSDALHLQALLEACAFAGIAQSHCRPGGIVSVLARVTLAEIRRHAPVMGIPTGAVLSIILPGVLHGVDSLHLPITWDSVLDVFTLSNAEIRDHWNRAPWMVAADRLDAVRRVLGGPSVFEDIGIHFADDDIHSIAEKTAAHVEADSRLYGTWVWEDPVADDGGSDGKHWVLREAVERILRGCCRSRDVPQAA